MDGGTNGLTDRQTGRQMGQLTNSQTHRWMDGQIGGRKNRWTDIFSKKKNEIKSGPALIVLNKFLS
jgi:hypothetical protein